MVLSILSVIYIYAKRVVCSARIAHFYTLVPYHPIYFALIDFHQITTTFIRPPLAKFFSGMYIHENCFFIFFYFKKTLPPPIKKNLPSPLPSISFSDRKKQQSSCVFFNVLIGGL